MSKAYKSICRQMGETVIASQMGVTSSAEVATTLAGTTSMAAAHILRLGQTIHRLEKKLGKRNRKSARQHNVLSTYKRREYYATKAVQLGDGRSVQFPAMTVGLPAERLP